MKAIFKLALVVAVCSLGFQLVAVASNKANTDKIKDSIDNVFGNNNNNNNNENKPDTPSTGETPVKPSEALKYSNLTIQENEPEDKSTIWLKTNNNITDIEKTNNYYTNINNTSNFKRVMDISQFDSSNVLNLQDEKLYAYFKDKLICFSSDYTNKNVIFSIYDGNEIVKKTVNFSDFGNSYFITSDKDNLKFIVLYSNKILIYSFDKNLNLDLNNPIIISDLSSISYGTSYFSSCLLFNNKLYFINWSNQKWNFCLDLNDNSLVNIESDSRANSSNHYKFMYISENKAYFENGSQHYYCLDFENNTYKLFKTISLSNYSKFKIGNYYYRYYISSYSDYSSGSATSKYGLFEDKFDDSFIKISTNLIQIDQPLSYADVFKSYEYDEETNSILLFFDSGSYEGIYKISKEKESLSKNKLIIVDNDLSINYTGSYTYIKINDLFSYKLYDPKFYVGDENDKLKEVYAYKYDTSSSSWQLI